MFLVRPGTVGCSADGTPVGDFAGSACRLQVATSDTSTQQQYTLLSRCVMHDEEQNVSGVDSTVLTSTIMLPLCRIQKGMFRKH